MPPINLRRIAARIPRAELRVFPGAHAFLFQERRPFTRAVDRFLDIRVEWSIDPRIRG